VLDANKALTVSTLKKLDVPAALEGLVEVQGRG
jgi:hypothetical protein